MLTSSDSRELATLTKTPTWLEMLYQGTLPDFLRRCEAAGRISRLSSDDKAIVEQAQREKALQETKINTALLSNPFAD